MAADCSEGNHQSLHRLGTEKAMHFETLFYLKNLSLQHPAHWIVPFERNAHFTDREAELAKLHDMLFDNPKFSKASICGLGGIGKTQVVLEFLHRLREKYTHYSTIWIQATSMETLDHDYCAVAQQLGIPNSSSTDVNIKKLVQDYLSSESAGHWVLVYDSADDMEMWIDKPTTQSTRLIDFIPRSKYGRVILTTRDRKLAVKFAHENVMEVPQMSEDAATATLRNYLIDQDLVDSEPTDTKKMLTWLTHHPLAIAQASAYINQNGMSIADYLELVDGEDAELIELLSEDFEDDARYADMKNPVATTWLISFRQTQQRDRLAASYLSFMAWLDHKNIPLTLLPSGPSRKAETDAIGILSAYSFITRHSDDASIDMHRLVHLAVRSWLRNEESSCGSESAYNAMARMSEVFPRPGSQECSLAEARLSLECKLAECYYLDGSFSEAEAMYRQVMDIRMGWPGAEHPDTLRCMAKLALTYHAQSRFQEAKELGLKAMQGQKKVLGEDHPETLSTISHLAMTCSDLSQWTEAKELELEALEGRECNLGIDHPDTLTSESNLVYLYNCQGYWKHAASLGKRVITSRRQDLGVEHPDTLLSIGNLAHTYNNQGLYQAAEELLVQVMNIRIRVLGKDHPHTLSGMSNLAVTYQHQGRLDEAEALHAQVVATRKATLGSEHFSALTSMAHLSSTYHSQGRLAEAEKLGIEVIELRRKVLGSDHHHTLTSMANLASIYLDAEQLTKAEELGLQVLATRIRVLSMGHYHTLKTMELVAAIHRKQGKTKECEDLELLLAEIRKPRVFV